MVWAALSPAKRKSNRLLSEDTGWSGESFGTKGCSSSFAVHAVAPNGQEIVIEDAAEEDPIEFFVARVCAVADLRCDDHCLTFNGVSLEKGHTLKSYGITKSEKLEIRPRLAGVTTPSRGSQGSPRFGSVGSVGSHNSLSALMSPMPVGAAPLHTCDELIDFGI